MTQTSASATWLKRAWTLSLPSQKRAALDLAKWLTEEGCASTSIIAELTPAGGLAVTTLTFRTLVGGPSFDALSARLQTISSPRLTSDKASAASSTGWQVNLTSSNGFPEAKTLTSQWPPSSTEKP